MFISKQGTNPFFSRAKSLYTLPVDIPVAWGENISSSFSLRGEYSSIPSFAGNACGLQSIFIVIQSLSSVTTTIIPLRLSSASSSSWLSLSSTCWRRYLSQVFPEPGKEARAVTGPGAAWREHIFLFSFIFCWTMKIHLSLLIFIWLRIKTILIFSWPWCQVVCTNLFFHTYSI